MPHRDNPPCLVSRSVVSLGVPHTREGVMLDGPVAMSDEEILADASERLGAAEWPPEYDGLYVECPGCALLVHHSDTSDHPERCRALRDLVAWEATGTVRDAQSARLSGGAS